MPQQTLQMIKVVFFEDNAEWADEIIQLFTSENGIQFCGLWENCDHVKKIMEIHSPDIVLMDIEMPGTNGLEGLKIIHQHFPHVNVLMLTIFEDDHSVFNAVCYGATGYLVKSTAAQKIVEAIHDLYNGGAPMTASVARKVLQLFSKHAPRSNESYNLTAREKDILTSLVKGNSYKMIGFDLSISIETVRTHIKKVYDKLHVHSMSEAVAKAIKQGIV
jgi:DNA-binding NarL/FixJ family response regulator